MVLDLGIETVKQLSKCIALTIALATIAFAANCAEIDAEAEAKSYLPLIPDSSYTYNAVFEGRKSTDTLIVKSDTRADAELFYFVVEKDVRNPDALISTTSLGLGLYTKDADGIATLRCFFKNGLNSLNAASLARRATILKTSPEAGQAAVIPDADGSFKRTYRIEGVEDVTVPAGTFKACVKMKTEEIEVRKPPEENVVLTGTVWLAKGVGVVKWIRATGRVEELAAYKLAEVKKK